MPEIRVPASELLQPRCPQLEHLRPGQRYSIVIVHQQAEMLEVDDKRFRTESAVPHIEEPESGGASETPSESEEPNVGFVAACLRYCEEHPGKKILIAGHTDTTGAADYNVRLSEQRGQMVHAMITGDRETFRHTAQARHVSGDKQQVLDWVEKRLGWPCGMQTNSGSLWQATRAFQKSYNENGRAGNLAAPALAEDGDFRELTWGAVFDCYELNHAEELGCELADLAEFRSRLCFLDPDAPYVGCGEYHPIEAQDQDNYRSQTNRRVEILYFDAADVPVLPCHVAACEPDSCPLYNRACWRRAPLPAMPSALPWTASWEEPEQPAQMSRKRKLVLDAPGLPAGYLMTFEITQAAEGNTATAARLEGIVSEDEHAETEWGKWFAPERVMYRRRVTKGGAFPPVSFSFSVSGAARLVHTEQPLTYGDVLDVQVGLKIPEDEIPVAGADCLLHSPWGILESKIDDRGHLLVRELPPGGVSLSVADRLYVPAD